jgi:phosphate ABC transporter ATP-binding protein
MLTSRDLDLFYGETRALKKITLAMPENRITALIGPSGCGKSTFLRCFNRMNDVIEGVRVTGEVKVDGQDIYHPGIDLERLRKRVGMVFQKSNPFPMSIRDNITFGPRMSGVRDRARLGETVERSLKQADLWNEVKDRLNDSALDLSGGQQQRLCIARALANEPDILLLDEPLSALDAKLRSELQLELKRTQRRLGTTFILVTHDQHEALTLSDRIAVMHDGRAEQVGTAAELYETPRTPYVAEFLGLSNCLEVLSIDNHTAQTPIGSLKLAQAGRTGVQLMIRPERLKLAREPRPEYNQFEALVRERIYLGSSIRYTLDVAGQSLSAILAHEGHGRLLPEEGERVLVQVHPSDIVPLVSE